MTGPMLSTRRPRRFLALSGGILAVGALILAREASAQSGAWAARGPLGGNVYCVSPDPSNPSIIFAGTDQGVFKSDDGGATWGSSSAGMPTVRVQTIAVDPAGSGTVYAGTLTPNGVASVGIFKSSDGGTSWTAVNAGLIDPFIGVGPVDVSALAIDPRNSNTVYAGTRFSEIFKSTDGGATWQPKTFGGYNVSLQTWAFQFAPSSPSTIYAASTLGLLRSADGGETWTTYGNAGAPFFALAVDPSSASTLYAGDSSGSGIWKSVDAGAHWSTVNSSLPVLRDSSGTYSPLVVALAVDPAHSATVYAATYGNGVFESTNGGSSWTAIDNGLPNPYLLSLSLSPAPGSRILAGTRGDGIFRSGDGGATWAPTNSGFIASLVSTVVLDPASVDTLWAATNSGVQKSTDGGATWQGSSNGLPANAVAALVIVPGSPERLYAGTLGGGLFKSSDGGASWSASAQGLADSYVSSIAVDPSSSSTLYAGTAHPYNGSNSERVYKSTDGGATWTQTGLDAQGFSVDFIAVNPKNSSQIVAGSRGVFGYFQSLDGGKTWSTIGTSTSCGATNQIVFDPASSTVYLAGTAGACRSTDAGKTWGLTPVGDSASVDTLLVVGSNPTLVYAGTTVDPAAGTGVFVSADAGQTWKPVGSGFPLAAVTSLAVDGLGKALHAGTQGAGVAELIFSKDRQPVQTPDRGNRTPRPLGRR